MKDWIQILKRECARSSMSAVARRIGYSAPAVSLVLQGRYGADTSRIERAVRGALMDQTVACPVLGDIPMHHCLEYQGRPFAATNPTRVQLYRACRGGCPHSLQGGKP